MAILTGFSGLALIFAVAMMSVPWHHEMWRESETSFDQETNLNDQVITTITSTGGAVIVGSAGMWISTNQLGKRFDDFGRWLDIIRADIKGFCKILGQQDKRISRMEDKQQWPSIISAEGYAPIEQGAGDPAVQRSRDRAHYRIDWRGESGGAAALRAVAAQVLYWDRVVPWNVVLRSAESGR
jgi:hypothetical protein